MGLNSNKTTKENILFLINPVSGDKSAIKETVDVERYCQSKGLNYKIEFTKAIDDAQKIIFENPNYDVYVAVGGDGTINEVATGILNKGSGVLGIIPRGTGNDFCRSLEIPKDLKKCLDIITGQRYKEIDVGLADDRYFLNVASIGLDAEVVNQTEKIKEYIKGKKAYIIGVFFALVKYKSVRTSIKIDNTLSENDLMLFAVGNGKYYGGGMKILPNASVDDNRLSYCMVKNILKFRVLTLFPTIFSGKHLRYKKYVVEGKADIVEVDSGNNMILNLDGKLYHLEKKKITFKMNAKKLKIKY
ncbi:MAG: diacylglycerol kinase family lipid kinase [Tissierellales bacterium]|nr:diacylglycerol kinase family lipid kinase [Tissierellales bacterium]